jgi:gliding motility-associated-like protein
MNKNILPSLLALLYFFAIPFVAFAQEADDYEFLTNNNSSFADMTNSTTIIAGDAFQEASPVLPLGFEFWFMGVRYTDFSINTNAVIQLGKTPINALANAYNIDNTPRIAAFTSGFQNLALLRLGDWKTASNGKIHYKSFGNFPNRIIVIEALHLLINHTANTETATFQIWLYETPPLTTNVVTNINSGKIEFRYATMQCALDKIEAVRVGIGSNSSKNTFKGVDFIATPPVAKIADNEILNVINKGNITNLHSPIATNLRIFSFESPIPNGQVSNVKGTDNGTEITLTWEKNGTNVVGSVIYKSTNGKDFSFLTQVNNANTFVDKEVKLCVDYYYRVYTVTEGKLGTLQTSANITYQMTPMLSIGIEGNTFSCPSNPSSVKPLKAVDTNKQFEKYFWLDSKGDTVGRGESFSPTETGNYILIGQTKEGCTARKEFSTVECCEVEVVIPTAFTPFNTPVNNIFLVKAENTVLFSLKIFNRWGIEVFSANNPTLGWNGLFYNGEPMQAGAYQVVVEYTGCKNGATVQESKMAVLYLIE